MTAARRSVMWPLIVLVVGCVWLLMVAGAFPAAVGDILRRAWPALLILFGLDVLVGQRRFSVVGRAVPLNYLALAVVLALLAGVTWYAYQQQADVVRDDTQVLVDEVLPDEVEQVQVLIDVQRTDITVNPATGARQIAAQFSGSKESVVEMVLDVQGRSAVLTISETYVHTIPKLEDLGRGTLAISLPVGTTVEQVALTSAQGDVTLDLRPVLAELLNITLRGGNLTLTLPDRTALLGNLRASGGNLNLNVPFSVALTLNRGEGSGTPRYSYDADRYDLLADGELKRQNTPEFNVGLTVWLDNGRPLIVTDVE